MKGKKHGQGIWTKNNGEYYEGEFVNGLKEGFGIQRMENG